MVIPVHAKLLFSVAPGANNVKLKKKALYKNSAGLLVLKTKTEE